MDKGKAMQKKHREDLKLRIAKFDRMLRGKLTPKLRQKTVSRRKKAASLLGVTVPKMSSKVGPYPRCFQDGFAEGERLPRFWIFWENGRRFLDDNTGHNLDSLYSLDEMRMHRQGGVREVSHKTVFDSFVKHPEFKSVFLSMVDGSFNQSEKEHLSF